MRNYPGVQLPRFAVDSAPPSPEPTADEHSIHLETMRHHQQQQQHQHPHPEQAPFRQPEAAEQDGAPSDREVFRVPDPPALCMSRLRNLLVVSVQSPPASQKPHLLAGAAEEEPEPEEPVYASAPSSLSMQRVCDVVGCDCSDLRLIINVAAIYHPNVLNSVVL